MTATERPRFRTDLVAEPIDDGGLRFIDVLDPDSGNGFRFFEVEYSIACAMDGERDLAGLMRWAREELGVEPSLKEIGTVITTLGDLGYLEGASTEAAALADDGPELVPGVVVAPRPEPGRFNDDVELGTAGQSPELARTLEAMPVPDEMELGTAGRGRTAAPSAREDFGGGPELGPAGGPSAPPSSHERTTDFEGLTPPPAEMPSASLRPSGRADAEEDGPTNLPQPATMDYEDDEVSVALSDHLAVSASDVKEAVRASKVMAAVDVPSDVLEQLEADEARAREEAAAAAAAREKIVAEAAQAEAAQEAAARAATLAAREASAREALEREAAVTTAREAAAREARPVSDLPEIPVGVSKKKADKKADKEPVVAAKEPPATTPVEAPQRGASRALWLLLLLAIVIAGGYLVWTKVLKKPLPWEPKDEAVESTASGAGKTAPPGPTAVEPPPAPPPPPPPVATLAEKAGEVSNIVAGQVAALSFVIADGSQVATGDAVLRFSGNAADEQKMVGFNYDIDKRYPKQIEDATKLRDKPGALPAAVKAQQAKIDEVSKKLEARKVERDALSTKLDALTIKAPIAGVVKLADKIAKGTRTTADQSVASVTAPSSLTATFTVVAASQKVYTPDASVRVSVKATPDQKANCTSTAVENLSAGGSTVTVVCPADAGVASGTEIVLE